MHHKLSYYQKHENKKTTPQSIPVISLTDRSRSNRVWGNYLPITFDWQTRLYSFMVIWTLAWSSVFHLGLRYWNISLKAPETNDTALFEKWVFKMNFYTIRLSACRTVKSGGKFRLLTSRLKTKQSCLVLLLFPQLIISSMLKQKRHIVMFCILIIWN